MPAEIFKVSQIVDKKADDTVTFRDFTKMITELNKALSEIGVALGRVNGRDAAITQFANNIDMDGHNITNVGEIKFGARTHASSSGPFEGIYSVDPPTDSPASADALRDDLANNIFPDIEAALNDIGAQLKQVLTVLRL